MSTAAAIAGAEPDLIARREGFAGIIRLNRPKAPNAIREELERASSLYLGADDRQFVTVVSTGGGLTGSQVTNDEIIAFALPKK